MRPSQLFSIFDREFISAKQGSHTPVMVWGPPGIGKSQLVADVAVHHGVPIIDVRLSQMEPSDLRGIPCTLPATVFRYDLMWEFVSAICEKRDAVPSFYDGLRAQVVADAVLQSHEGGNWIDIPDEPR